MRILKAYADAGATGNQNFGLPVTRKVEREAREQRQSPAGDRISLSAEAREMLASGEESVSVCPQDATYDQYGNMTRQFDSLQQDLRGLAGKAMAEGDMALAGKLGILGNRLAALKAQV